MIVSIADTFSTILLTIYVKIYTGFYRLSFDTIFIKSLLFEA